MMHRPLRARHVLGDELPRPASTQLVEEGELVALFEPEHERVEVRGGPDAQEGEAGVGVLAGKLPGLGKERGGGLVWVLEGGGHALVG